VVDLDKARASNDIGKMIALQKAIKFNGGGHINHSLFWENLAPPKNNGGHGGGEAVGSLGEALNKEFGSFKQFAEKFSTAGSRR
jgi:Fe-Mn family superoxide dismutase